MYTFWKEMSSLPICHRLLLNLVLIGLTNCLVVGTLMPVMGTWPTIRRHLTRLRGTTHSFRTHSFRGWRIRSSHSSKGMLRVSRIYFSSSHGTRMRYTRTYPPLE